MRSLSKVTKSRLASTDGGNSVAEVCDTAGDGRGRFSSCMLDGS